MGGPQYLSKRFRCEYRSSFRTCVRSWLSKHGLQLPQNLLPRSEAAYVMLYKCKEPEKIRKTRTILMSHRGILVKSKSHSKATHEIICSGISWPSFFLHWSAFRRTRESHTALASRTPKSFWMHGHSSVAVVHTDEIICCCCCCCLYRLLWCF